MSAKFGLVLGALVAATTFALATGVEADAEIDASTFVNDAKFCGDGEHDIPAGEILTIDGGSGIRPSCRVRLGEASTFEIVGEATLDIGIFNVEDFFQTGEVSNDVTFKIKDSRIFGGDLAADLFKGENNTINCRRSLLVADGGDIDLRAGTGGLVKLDNCRLTNLDGSLDFIVAPNPDQSGGELDIEDSIITIENTATLSVGGSDGVVDIDDSVFMGSFRLSITTLGKLRTEENVFAKIMTFVVNADNCRSEDDFVVGSGLTDICL